MAPAIAGWRVERLTCWGVLDIGRFDDEVCSVFRAVEKGLSVLSKPYFWFACKGDEDGQTMVEYAVVLGVITLAIVAAFSGLSSTISSAVTDVTGRI
jgi:Flp pilus assembly pilin Flp